MKSRSKNRTPNIVNLTVKRRYLTQREIERLMDCARKHGRYGHRDATSQGDRGGSGSRPELAGARKRRHQDAQGLRSAPPTPTYSFPSAAGQSAPSVSTASSSAQAPARQAISEIPPAGSASPSLSPCGRRDGRQDASRGWYRRSA